jgi:superfamily II DNA or RNA helicase
MEQFIQELLNCLNTGFINKENLLSRRDYLPELILNNSIEGKKVLTTIDRELKDCDEFWFSVAFVTNSGVAVLINILDYLNEKNIKGRILVSQYQNFTQPEALKRLLSFKNIELKILVTGAFHAKGYLFKRANYYNLIIGSSNLTANALCSNKEWNLKITATENSNLIYSTLSEFQNEFKEALPVTKEFIEAYEIIYKKQKKLLNADNRLLEQLTPRPQPNKMQKDALANIKAMRTKGKSKVLLISATGTGKTYLSAFDAQEFKPNTFLFIVHRIDIAAKALDTFRKVFGDTISMGLYNDEKENPTSDFLFTTIQTLSRDNHLSKFGKTQFDYIVIDETHHAGANTYQKILNHFAPKFLLGMTATPERTDGFDIFNEFDYNIAYEIRLQKALEEDMLCPFHYYGVCDVEINNNKISEEKAFKLLTANERIDRILEKANHYGCDDGNVRGLIFCSSKKEIHAFSKAFNQKGLRTVALDRDSKSDERQKAIARLESDDEKQRLDYIFTVEIFGEGIDIPRVNQVILLRPTQSAIVFVQQLGRGLRKCDNKEYLTVIDFISNYKNNYLIPIALYGDTTYNKDRLRKLLASGNNLIPGASTINFEKIAQDKIFESINTATMTLQKDLAEDYKYLKYRLGRNPMMMDFVAQKARDPFLYVTYAKSFYNFAYKMEKNAIENLNTEMRTLLELFSFNIGNGKRIEEIIIIKHLLKNPALSIATFKKFMHNNYQITYINDLTFNSSIRNINFDFINKGKDIIKSDNKRVRFSTNFVTKLKNETFRKFFNDILDYGENIFNDHFENGVYLDGFILNEKYSRRDVCRILNWPKNEESTIYGYKIKNNTVPLFVTLKKHDKIAASIKYGDKFISPNKFHWYTKSNRTLSSKDVLQFYQTKSNLRVLLFVKKHDGEGSDFYYLGELLSLENSFRQKQMKNENGEKLPVVTIDFQLKYEVEESLYEYLTN